LIGFVVEGKISISMME